MSELDAKLFCPTCNGYPYYVYRDPIPGTCAFSHRLEAHDGAPEPPTSGTPKCPRCQGELVRE